MKPENHEDVLRRWALALGRDVCIVSVDYGKVTELGRRWSLIKFGHS